MGAEPTMGAVVLGATSAMAERVARRWASRGARLLLVARNETRLEAIRDDLLVRGAARVDILAVDLSDRPALRRDVIPTIRAFGPLDVALIAHGVMPPQAESARDGELAAQVMDVNATSVVALCVEIAQLLREQGKGTLTVFSSMAGERGRVGNYVYGASKAALTVFLEGMRADLAGAGVQVCTIKPGPVVTPMTAGKDPSFLWIDADRAADAIVHGIDRGRRVLYVPWFWRPVAFLLRLLPERLVTNLEA